MVHGGWLGLRCSVSLVGSMCVVLRWSLLPPLSFVLGAGGWDLACGFLSCDGGVVGWNSDLTHLAGHKLKQTNKKVVFYTVPSLLINQSFNRVLDPWLLLPRVWGIACSAVALPGLRDWELCTLSGALTCSAVRVRFGGTYDPLLCAG